MTYEEWERDVPREIRGDSVWRIKAYRLSLLAADLSWNDATKLLRDEHTRRTSDQLFRSVGSMSANICEGYSRSSAKDRARFYEYALGSARESRTWVYQARRVLGEAVYSHRTQLFTEIIKLLLTMIPRQVRYRVREDMEAYEVSTDLPLLGDASFDGDENIPM
jgi:four helix bundle protein